jgi:hypothetical protein
MGDPRSVDRFIKHLLKDPHPRPRNELRIASFIKENPPPGEWVPRKFVGYSPHIPLLHTPPDRFTKLFCTDATYHLVVHGSLRNHVKKLGTSNILNMFIQQYISPRLGSLIYSELHGRYTLMGYTILPPLFVYANKQSTIIAPYITLVMYDNGPIIPIVSGTSSILTLKYLYSLRNDGTCDDEFMTRELKRLHIDCVIESGTH